MDIIDNNQEKRYAERRHEMRHDELEYPTSNITKSTRRLKEIFFHSPRPSSHSPHLKDGLFYHKRLFFYCYFSL